MEKSVAPAYTFPLARQIKGLSGTANEDLSTWPTVFEPALGENLPAFLKRKHAVIDYLSGTTDAILRQRHGLSLKEGRPGIMKNSPKIAYLSELKSEF